VPEEIRVLARVLKFMVVLLDCEGMAGMADAGVAAGADNIQGGSANIVGLGPRCSVCYKNAPHKLPERLDEFSTEGETGSMTTAC
jgi:hypothetical protein